MIQLFLDLINNLMVLKLNSYAPKCACFYLCARTCTHTSPNGTATANKDTRQ